MIFLKKYTCVSDKIDIKLYGSRSDGVKRLEIVQDAVGREITFDMYEDVTDTFEAEIRYAAQAVRSACQFKNDQVEFYFQTAGGIDLVLYKNNEEGGYVLKNRADPEQQPMKIKHLPSFYCALVSAASFANE